MAKWGTAYDKPEDKIPVTMVAETKEDLVNNPSHYNKGPIECIDYIRSCMTPEEFRGFLRGNLIKYQHRHKYKGKELEDLQKAQWCLAKLIETYQ